MSIENANEPGLIWQKFAADLIVPVLLSAYATYYYLDVAQLPRPETNLLLIGPVYWILIASSVAFAALRLRDTLRRIAVKVPKSDTTPTAGSVGKVPFGRALAFVVLTIACVWAIPVLGFATTIAAYTLLMLLVLGVRSLPQLLLTPTLLAGSLWAGMELFLNLRVPAGLFF